MSSGSRYCSCFSRYSVCYILYPYKRKGFCIHKLRNMVTVGTELQNPILEREAMEAQYTNEGGYDDTIIFLKNIMSMWIFYETCRQWKHEGNEIQTGI